MTNWNIWVGIGFLVVSAIWIDTGRIRFRYDKFSSFGVYGAFLCALLYIIIAICFFMRPII